MKYVWKKHTMGKRILALFLLVIMLFDTVTASAIEYDGEESTQTEIVEVVENTMDTSAEEVAQLEMTTESEVVTESEVTTELEVVTGTETTEVQEELATEAETEEVTESVSDAEEIEIDIVQNTNDSIGVFENIQVRFFGYNVIINGGFTSNSEKVVNIWMESYDSEGNAIQRGSASMSYVPAGGGTITFDGRCFSIPETTAYVRIEAMESDYVGWGIEGPGDISSEKFTFVYTPEERGQFEDARITFNGYEARLDGSFTSLCSETSSVELVYYNDADEKVSATHITDCSRGITVRFNSSYEIPNGVAYARIEVVSNLEESELQPVYSEKFIRASEPDFTLSVEDIEAGAAGVTLTVGYEGDLALSSLNSSLYLSGELHYGTSADESTWSKKNIGVSLYGDRNTATLKINDLESDTTYYGKIYFYKRVYDSKTNEYIYVYEQTISLDSFKTTVNNTYNLKTAFPDAVLRLLVLERMYDNTLTEDSDVTTAQLEKITSIYNSRSTYNVVEPVRDLSGIELLTNLESLSLSGNELESVTSIDWSKMPRLARLYLDENNLTEVPDLSTNMLLEYVDFSDNMLSDTELQKLLECVPEGALSNQTLTSQRNKVVELELEDTYYKYAAGTPVIVQIKGQKCYSVKLFVDDVEQTFTASGNRLTIENCGADIGSHTIKAELYSGDTKVSETEAYAFTVADTPVFVENGKIYANTDETYVYVFLLMPEQKNISAATVIDESGKVFAKNSSTPSVNSWTIEPRFENSWCYLPNNYLYYAGINMAIEYNTIPVGSYDVSIVYSDGTTATLKNAVEIVGKQDAIITDVYSRNYDRIDCDEYIYLEMQGYHLDAEKFDYTLKYAFIEMPIRYVDSKVSGTNSMLVKLKKDGWTEYPEQNGTGTLTVTPKDGYEVYGSVEPVSCYLQSLSMVYYSTYNFALEKLEIAVDEEYQNSAISVEVREGYDANTYPLLASGSGMVSGERVFLDLLTSDGSKFTPVNNKTYYVKYTIGNKTETDTINCYNYITTTRTNYWNTTPSVIQGNTSVYAYYYSDIPYGTVDAADFTAQISGGTITAAIAAKRVWTGSNNGNTMIGMEFDPSSLEEGVYNITLNKDEAVFATNTLKVLADGKFYLNSTYASWLSDSEIQLNISTLNSSENDDFNVAVTEENGTIVEGLTTEVTKRYTSGTVYVSIKGLNYDSACKKYYIKVTHKTLGEAYKADGSNYYSDEKGVLITVGRSSWSWATNAKGEVIGIYLNDAGIAFPATIRIHNPYDTAVVKEIIVKDASELVNTYYYYFSKSFYDSLPTPGGTYNIAISDTTGILGYLTRVIGYNPDAKDEEETKTWSYTVDKTKLNIDSESEKTATITVKDYTKAPTFKSSNTAVAKVAISSDDKGKAVITAVSEGTAEITITADGTSKSFEVIVISSVPKVQAQNNVVINTFFGNEAKTALEITNSFNTAVKKVTMTEAVAGLAVEQIDGTWYLCSDGSTIAKNTKVTLAFEVEGFEATGDLAIAPQTITVNGVNTQPAATLSATTIDFNAYPYTEKAVDLSVKNNDYRNIVVVNPEDIVLTAVPKGVNKDNAKVTVSYDAANAKLVAKASDEATNGTYKFTITPGVGTDGAKKAKEIVLTVNLKATKPEFKFNTTSVSLDAAYPGESEGSIKLLMDEGYVLDVEGTSVLAPNDSVNDFINVEKNTDGTITFRVTKAGLSTAGTYKITAKVKSEWGSTYELKEAKVTVKVTNSSKVTLSSKSKSVTINPYVGYANVKANLAVKGFTAQDSVEYTTYYSYVPTNELAKNATDMRLIFNEDGTISITGCSAYEDGKYTYNLLGTIVGNDGTVTYTKPLVFTVQLKAKTLTIVPAKKSVTVYADYCTTVVKEGTTYYKVEIPVNVKEDAGRILNMALTNSMETSSVSAKVEDSILVVEFPTTLTKLNNVTFTSADTSYAAFKASITVNTKDPKPVFTAKKITMNRYTDATVTNTVVDTEGYSVISLKNVVINKGKNVDATGWFSVNSTNGVINGSTISISIPQEHDADIVNGDYTVSLTPVIKIGENEKELPACTFTLKVAQPKVKLGIGNIKTVSQTVNLYPSIDEKTSEKFEVKAYADNKEIAISGINVTTKDKTVVTTSTTEDNNIVLFTAVENTGKNTYVVTAKVKKANGVVEEEEVTLNKAFVVNVKELPTSIKLAKKKLTFSPYVESKVSTTINSPELASLMKTGDFTYRISAVETNSKYKDLAAELKNNILSVTGSRDGIITVDNTGYVTKNTTFYYLVTVELMQNGKQEAVATYTDKLSVVVKNTLPKAELQLKSISLDNAFVSQNVTNRVMLTTGSGLWTIDALTNADIVIKSGSKDVTSEGYFNVTYDGSRFTVGLNNKKADGTLITVPKGSYKFEIIPKVSERNGDKDATLAKLTLTVKVTSNRPTIKMASKVTVKAGQATQYIEPTLKNNGTLTEASICTCTKYPNKADETDVAGIEVKVMSDGNISAKADAGVMAGSYTFTINPVTIIDGKEILLDAKKLTVVVK